MAVTLPSKVESWLRSIGPSGLGAFLRPLLVSARPQAITADGTTLTNTVTETTLASKTVLGLAAGDVLKVTYLGIAPSTNSTDTLTCKLYVGTEVICTTANPDAVDDDEQKIFATIQIRAGGSSGSLLAVGQHMNDAAATALTEFHKAVASEDLSGEVTVKVTGTWSVAHADNQCNAEMFIVEHLKAS